VQDVLEKDPLSEQISALRQEQETLRRQRKELSKTLKLAERKKTRLRKRAKAMTDEDLIQVLMMRKEQREFAAAEGTGDRHRVAETEAGGEEGDD
jgi:predicted  nucleic acid-binding Zn-ribbon protein